MCHLAPLIYCITVAMNGEIWNAESRDHLDINDRVKVFDIQGLTLTVGRIQSEN